MNEFEWQLLEDKSQLGAVDIRGVLVRPGDKVRLRPQLRGDVFDIVLNGKVAVVESIEQDYEGNFHVSVVVDEDPGRDIGLLRQPGHRFFFATTEVETIAEDRVTDKIAGKKILIAGIGNIFLGDDGFGVEVTARLTRQTFPAGVHVTDFGIRGLDLAYALMEGYATVILVDAYPGEGAPGTLFVVQPELSDLRSASAPLGLIEPHAMDPLKVLQMASDMGGQLNRVLLVGCVPGTLGPDEGQMGLSAPVAGAVEDAVKLVGSLVERIIAGEWPAKE